MSKDTAESVRSARSAISQKNSLYNSSASSTSSAWKGDVGESFKNWNRNFRSKLTALLRQYNTLSSSLNSLENSIKRAENEARRAARRR